MYRSKNMLLILVFILLFSSLAPYYVSGQEVVKTGESESEYKKALVNKEALIYQDDGEETLTIGKVNKGAIFFVQSFEGEKIYIQWDEGLAYLKKEDVEGIVFCEFKNLRSLMNKYI